MYPTGEVITMREALTRVGLGELAEGAWSPDEQHVEWKGYPKPFECGHSAVYGFGPLDNESINDLHGKGRRYQKHARVSQHCCGGPVLFAWGGVKVPSDPKRLPYHLNTSLVVSIEELPDRKSTCLVVGWTG